MYIYLICLILILHYIKIILIRYAFYIDASNILLQRVSIACYAEPCISHDRFCLTDRPTL